MSPKLAPDTAIFSSHTHQKKTLEGALVSAVSPMGELTVEVSFDTLDYNPSEFFYVDLNNDNSGLSVHFSLRVKDNYFVVNTRQNGEWGTHDVAAGVDFSAMRFWRFWLVVEPHGGMRVQLAGKTICRLDDPKISASALTSLESNVSAQCVVAPFGQNTDVVGVWGQTTGGESVALFSVSPHLDADPQTLTVLVDDEPADSSNIRPLQIGPDYWHLAQLGQLAGHKMDLLISELSLSVFKVNEVPVVEMGAGSATLRTSTACEASDVSWALAGQDLEAAVRLVTGVDEFGGASQSKLQRCLTPLSEFLRRVPDDGQILEYILKAPGVPDGFYRIHIGEHTYRAMEFYTQRISVPSYGPQQETAADIQMAFLDWWSVLRAPEQDRYVKAHAPRLRSFLSEFASTRIALDGNTLALAGDVQPIGPAVDNVALWQAMREVAPILDSAEPDPQKIAEQVRKSSRLFPEGLREWFLLEVSADLLKLDLGYLLNSGISEDFLEECLENLENSWRASTVSAPLAARNRFEDCVKVIETLIEAKSTNFDARAVAATVTKAIEGGAPLGLRRRLMYALCSLVKGLDAGEFSPFRHVDIIDALIHILLESKLHPDWFREDVLSVVESYYTTVPEFWQRVDQVAQGSEEQLFGRRFAEIAKRARKVVGAFQSFKVYEDGAQPAVEDGYGSAVAGERGLQLKTFLELHGVAQPSMRETLIETSEDMLLRQSAHPFLEGRVRHGTVMRDVLMQKQKFPLLHHRSLVETVGRAIFAGDHALVRKLLMPWVGHLQDLEDLGTEAVMLEALAWAVAQTEAPASILSALTVQLIGRLKAYEGNPNAASPALFTAAMRLLAIPTDDKALMHQYEILKAYCPDTYRADIAAFEKGQPYFADTLIALVTCRPYLDTRAQECRETWIKDIEAAGAKVLFFCGSDKVSEDAIVDEATGVVQLAVGDTYEELPAKMLAMFRWIKDNRPENYVLKIDDDCYLDAENFLTALAYRRAHYFGRSLISRPEAFNRTWHQSRSQTEGAQRALDTSLTGTHYADGGGSYVVSRHGLEALGEAAASTSGLQLRMSSFFEDKMIGDLMHLAGVSLSDEGYTTMQSRRTHGGAHPVLMWDRTFYPSALSGISVAHLDRMGLMKHIRDNRDTTQLEPSRIWPMNAKPELTDMASMLELLTPGRAQERLEAAETLCVAAMRNEITILPHFLDHYRKQGVDLFLIADNVSDDGTREYLLEQPDVLLFSAGNEYKFSHYGVDWQRVLLDHFCAGRWVVLADADEFLITPHNKPGALKTYCRELEAQGFDGALVMMADMYPKGSMAEADFKRFAPADVATALDVSPVRPWALNRGPYGNMSSYVSNLRHRLMPLSAPYLFTAQKVALFRFNPLMSFSEGFHFGAGLSLSPEPLAFLHFKYSAEFAEKALKETQRGQHYGGGTEYRAYLELVENGLDSLWVDGVSKTVDLSKADVLSDILAGVPRTS